MTQHQALQVVLKWQWGKHAACTGGQPPALAQRVLTECAACKAVCGSADGGPGKHGRKNRDLGTGSAERNTQRVKVGGGEAE